MSMSIRAMSRKYEDVYDIMMRDEYRQFFYHDDFKRFEKQKMVFNLSFNNGKSGTGVVLLDDGRPVGFCIGVTRGHRIVTAVDSKYTGRGYASIMLELVIRKYLSVGISNIEATTMVYNKAMQRILDRTATRVGIDDQEIIYALHSNPSVDISEHVHVLNEMKVPK